MIWSLPGYYTNFCKFGFSGARSPFNFKNGNQLNITFFSYFFEYYLQVIFVGPLMEHPIYSPGKLDQKWAQFVIKSGQMFFWWFGFLEEVWTYPESSLHPKPLATPIVSHKVSIIQFFSFFSRSMLFTQKCLKTKIVFLEIPFNLIPNFTTLTWKLRAAWRNK